MPLKRSTTSASSLTTPSREEGDAAADFRAACEHAAVLLHYRDMIEKTAGTAGIESLAAYANRQRKAMGQSLTLLNVLEGKALDDAWKLWQKTAAEAHQQIAVLAHYVGQPEEHPEFLYG
ncbi:MAG: hypothetical protein Q7P63_10830 [Verrucomicrobiota bacterium JB022]|nr:hypothetical protein [Verrucomicrobiota bacterium JB022]